MRSAVTRLTPVWPNLPDARTFAPVVWLMVVLVPALLAWLFGHLSVSQSAWGVRGLDVLEGDPLLLFTPEGTCPPLFTWSAALALAVDLGDPFWRLTVPSYLFWLVSAVVLYQLVRRWHDETTALLTLVALAVNPVLLGQVQRGQAGTLALAWMVLALWAYIEHSHSGAGFRSWWVPAAGISIAMMVLTIGLSALWVPVLIAVHLTYDQIQNTSSWGDGLRRLYRNPTLRAGLAALALAAIIIVIWLAVAQTASGPIAIVSTVGFTGDRLGFEAPALAMPTTLALGLFGVARALRQRFRRQADRQASLPVLWALVAYLAFLLVEPSSTGLLFVVVPLTMLAMRSLQLVVNRRLRDRTSFALILATLVVFVFGSNPGLVDNMLDLFGRIIGAWGKMQRSGVEPDLGWQFLSIHLAIDAVVVGSLLLIALYSYSGRLDSLRRWLFGGFALFVLGMGAALGTSPWIRMPRSTDPWEELYLSTRALPANDWLVFLGESRPSVSLSFVVRVASGRLPTFRAVDVAELDAMMDREVGRPLVVVTDPSEALPDSLPLTREGVPITLGRAYRGEFAIIYTPIDKKASTPGS